MHCCSVFGLENTVKYSGVQKEFLAPWRRLTELSECFLVRNRTLLMRISHYVY